VHLAYHLDIHGDWNSQTAIYRGGLTRDQRLKKIKNTSGKIPRLVLVKKKTGLLETPETGFVCQCKNPRFITD
jgi:hypothetical protein